MEEALEAADGRGDAGAERPAGAIGATGCFTRGGYEVSFGRVARGGKNFTQVAKVTFEIGVSRN